MTFDLKGQTTIEEVKAKNGNYHNTSLHKDLPIFAISLFEFMHVPQDLLIIKYESLTFAKQLFEHSTCIRGNNLAI